MRVPFVVNFVASFVEIRIDEVRAKVRDEGDLLGTIKQGLQLATARFLETKSRTRSKKTLRTAITEVNEVTGTELDFFKKNGYLQLDDALTTEEVEFFRDLYDQDRVDRSFFWRDAGLGCHQWLNCDSLISSPEIDRLIRHPRLMAYVDELMGAPTSLSEVCIRHMPAYEGEIMQSWHRDRPHKMDHPLRMGWIHIMVYLTDVDEGTHCFSISPESIDEDILLNPEEQLERSGSVDIYGPAGTVALFNLSVMHTATVRPTMKERKTVQTYYGFQSGPSLSHHTTIPARLWRDHPDPEVRAFYGNLNDKSRLYAAAFG